LSALELLDIVEMGVRTLGEWYRGDVSGGVGPVADMWFDLSLADMAGPGSPLTVASRVNEEDFNGTPLLLLSAFSASTPNPVGVISAVSAMASKARTGLCRGPLGTQKSASVAVERPSQPQTSIVVFALSVV
jgi:hypothetical protein